MLDEPTPFPSFGVASLQLRNPGALEARISDRVEEGSRLALDRPSRMENHGATSWPRDMEQPSTIGPYRVVAPLGQGGMGVVYRARHIGSERAVALKTVSVPSARWLEAIRREIHALTQIRHPGVVRIVDHGVDRGRPWYAMDLLEGATLAQFGARIWSRFRRPSGPPVGPTEQVSVTAGASEDDGAPISERARRALETRPTADGPIPAAAGELRAVLRIMRRVSATLAFLHGEGFVNCDLKPDNILLLDGQPVIIDFGLTAHHPGRSGRESLEAQRGGSGTPPYMSPEQVRGDLVDARSDLYALGCMLYELVTGSPPFGGAPASVRSGHLLHPPSPPSTLVADVSAELERLILRLLDKDLTGRFGYADEVATLLAGLSDDVHRLPDFPPPRSYLYRPRLVGRDDVMAQLVSVRERAAEGGGTLVLVAGESGVGKTRIAMEVTRVLPSTRMHTVTSESFSLASGGGAAAPLQTIRPLLQAVADRCQEAGPEATERLLGDRRSVLAQYEPLLLQVPATGSLIPPIPLAVDASRRRLFKYLAETLAAFAVEQPVLWVIDDLGWADELSLSFLQSLTADYLEATPALILCTYRSEEANDSVKAISQLPHVMHLALGRLGLDAVSIMVGDMLALREPTEGFVEFVAAQAEGNPFFVAEYLRGAIGERLLYRDSRHQWQMGERAENGAQEYASLPLPGSLRELIEQRLRRLSPGGQQAILAAAVVGRVAELDILREVAGLSDEATLSAVDELVRRQVLEPVDEGRVRFAHDKLREVAYARAPADGLQRLHERAANVIEQRWADKVDANQQWAALGHHFAGANILEAAAKYFKLAADHARATHANEDAIRLYREAIKQADQVLLGLASESAHWIAIVVDLRQALGDLLMLGGRAQDARDVFETLVGNLPSDAELTADHALRRAGLLRRIGKTHEVQHQHEAALRAYSGAEDALGEAPDSSEQGGRAWWTEWFNVQTDRVMVYYWLANDGQIENVVQRIQSAPLSRGTASWQAQIFKSLGVLSMRRERYALTTQTVSYARRRLAASTECGDAGEILEARFMLGMALLFSGDGTEARREFIEALPDSERRGDMTLHSRFLAYLTVAWRRAQDVDKTRETAWRCLDLAQSSNIVEYVGTARANLGWAAWREGSSVQARTDCMAALQAWSGISFVYPFEWMARLVLLALDAERGAFGEALQHVTFILDAKQELLPHDLAAVLSEAGARGESLARVISVAQSRGFL
jgi:serine/threonine protein kinase/tetratricopeptide (TPR) repeat protein